jgi:hypothetical protein
MKLEVSHPLAATCNSGVVISGEDASRVAADYYGIIKKLLSIRSGVVFFSVIDLIQSTTPKWMILVWLRSSMNHAIQTSIFYVHIKRNRCTI